MTAIIGIDADILFVDASEPLVATQGGVATVSINSGGATYSENDVLTLTDGGDISCQLTVTAVTGGAVDEVSILVNGEGISTATGIATTVLPDNGTGCTIDIDSINGLCLPKWDTTDNTWTVLINDGDGDEYSWVQFPERNEFSISISVDIAEHKVFVASPADAWVEKSRLFMDWSGSMSGYLDTSNDTIFTKMKEGANLWVIFVNSKTSDAPTDDAVPAQYWLGKVILGSVDMSTPVEDYVTMDVDFAGSGELYRSDLPY